MLATPLPAPENLAKIKRRTPPVVARKIITEAAESTPAVADLLARARVYVEGSHAKQTLKAYAADWKHFSTWCEEHKRRSLPAAPETIICYLVETADSYRVATLDRRLASISYHHKQARHQLPTKDPEVSG